jgi:hypothetical protein
MFEERLGAAMERTPQPSTIEDLAANFVTLDGHKGIDPRSLRRLIKRYKDGRLPE